MDVGEGLTVYVAADHQLAQQVQQETAALGTNSIEELEDPSYVASGANSIVNICDLCVGKSVLGVGYSQVRIGSVVIDDAHAARSRVLAND